MVIKCSALRKAGIPILLIFQMITIVGIFVMHKEVVLESSAVMVVLFCLYILIDINLALDAYVIYRKIVMDENGCTIYFLNEKREYTWDEIAVKRLEKGYRRLRRIDPMQGVYFSVYPSKKSKKKDPYWYCMFHNPFHHFFVYLTEESEENLLNTAHNYTFTQNKNKFLAQLSLWKVQLTLD